MSEVRDDSILEGMSEQEIVAPVYTAEDVQEVMGWSRATLYRRMASGNFPEGHRVDGSRERLWTPEQLAAHLYTP